MSTEQTTVDILDMELESILNPGAESILIPNQDEPAKETLFKRPDTDLSFLDKEDKKDALPIAADAIKTDEEFNEVVNDIPAEETKKTGRPKTDKDGLVELANKLIEKNLLIPFDDDKPISEYTLTDFEELFEANAQERERSIREKVPNEFFENMPSEMQYAAKYLADGGTDLKGLFKTLAAVEEVKSLDPAEAGDQRQIIRSYLQATNFGTVEEIEEEINEWDDRGELEAKANKFKPKLDALSEQQVQYKLKQQETLRAQQAQQAEAYMDNVYKTLEPAEINGLKLDKKTQNLLFSGLVQPSYQSVSGKQTNLLGHLLEKYQFIEPNHSLVAEALWLLADPEGYKDKVRDVTKKEVVTDTVRKLKFEQASKLASHVQEEDDKDINKNKGKGIPRPSTNFFKR